ncbi:MAG: hypothetical protein ABL925_12340 [Methylococcales bacterium]
MMVFEKRLLFKLLFQAFLKNINTINIMNILTKAALTFLMTFSLGTVNAEEAATGSAAIIKETITHVEKALIEVKKSDFASAQLHLKAARASYETIPNFETGVVKQANDSVIQGQVEARKGNSEKSAVELNKALELYKSL